MYFKLLILHGAINFQFFFQDIDVKIHFNTTCPHIEKIAHINLEGLMYKSNIPNEYANGFCKKSKEFTIVLHVVYAKY